MTPKIVDVGEILSRWSGPRRIYRTPDDGDEWPVVRHKESRDAMLRLLQTPKTMPQMAEETGRSPDAIGRAIRKMQREGIVRLTGKRAGGPGRPRLWIACCVAT